VGLDLLEGRLARDVFQQGLAGEPEQAAWRRLSERPLCTCERRGARAAAGGAQLVERAKAVYLGAVDPAYRRCAVLDASVLRCAALRPSQAAICNPDQRPGALRKECRRLGVPATGTECLAVWQKTGWRASSFLPSARPARRAGFQAR